MKNVGVVCAALCLLSAYGCGQGEAPNVAELAAALRAHGVSYGVSETATLSGIRAEGLRLTGWRLAVEVYRIADRGQMRLATAAAEHAASEAKAGTDGQKTDARAQRLKYYVREPFLVIVRSEPEEGQVAAALGQVLGG
jgi:hypothetical protein